MGGPEMYLSHMHKGDYHAVAIRTMWVNRVFAAQYQLKMPIPLGEVNIKHPGRAENAASKLKIVMLFHFVRPV